MRDDGPLDEPSAQAARTAATAALDRRVTDLARIDEGVNALYRLDLADGDRAVLKTPLYATDEAFLVEPLLLSRLGAETTMPVPDVLASATAADGPLDTAYYVMDHVDGRVVPAALDLPHEAHERVVQEAGRHLAAVHERPVGLGWGEVVAVDGELAVLDPDDSWPATLDRLTANVVAALRGEGALADDDPWFADLAPAVRAALTDPDSPVADAEPKPSFVIGDYRPANLLLAPNDDADPLVRGVVDVGGLVGDCLLDVAMAEDALVDTPYGGTDRAGTLRETFRDAYATARGLAREAVFDDRYPYYRLYARADRLSALEYLAGFAREDEVEAVARRWRSFVEARLAEVEARV